MSLNHKVLDLSHWNVVAEGKKIPSSISSNIIDGSDGFEDLKNQSVEAVILKATQGTDWIDPTFFEYFRRAAQSQMMIGIYHFGTGDNVADQYHFFMKALSQALLNAPARIIVALDFERNPNGNQMKISQAQDFLHICKRAGFNPILYGGGYLRDASLLASDARLKNLSQYRLWINDEGAGRSTPRLPRGFSSYTFWQYSERLKYSGISGAVDTNHYNGPDLQKEWPS